MGCKMYRDVWLQVRSWYGDVRIEEYQVPNEHLKPAGGYYHPDVIIRVDAKLKDIAGGREAVNNALCAHIIGMGYKARLLTYGRERNSRSKKVDERQRKLL